MVIAPSSVIGQFENLLYTPTVARITDQSAAGNQIAAGTRKTFSAAAYAPLDIGSPAIPGGIVAVPGGYDLTGSGADIGGRRDQCQFAYREQSGDFDFRARLAGLSISDPYVKAGLMVRESPTDSVRFAAIFASSPQLGSFFESRSTASAVATMSGPSLKFPSAYPWAWLRLRRNGNEFTGYGSFDGQAWQSLGAINMALPAQVLFGMTVTSSATNAAATARFRDLGPVENPTSFSYAPSRESVGPSNRRTGLIFSEIMYRPKERADGTNIEFIEIYNGEAIFADLTGWRVTGGIDFAFPDAFRLQAGQFAVIAADPQAVQSVYGIQGVLGPYQGKLSHDKGRLTLLNQAGAVRAELTYSSAPPWPPSADGAGHSLVCLRPSYGEDDPRAWGASQLIGGSPGVDDPVVPNPWAGVVINEFLAKPAGEDSEFIELYNASNATVDLSGCFLTDSPKTNTFRIPDGTLIEARSWISFPKTLVGFGLSASGETIYLVSTDQSRILDAIRFEAQEEGVASGRSPDGGPVVRRLSNPTPDRANAGWRQEEVVINELMYKPISGDADDEYIELYNRSTNTVDLGGWRFNDGVNFSFPSGSSISAGGYLVVARNLQRMLTNYPQLNLANAVGNFSGTLKGGGDRVVLAKPAVKGKDIIYIAVSEVSYMTGGRWPELANGGGSSLELKDAHADPLLASNWATSDETQKAPWASYEVTGTLSLANQTYAANKLYIISLGQSECLVDDVEASRAGGTNVLSNPGFESGKTGWTFYGTHISSVVESNGAFSGNNCLHLRSLEVGDEGPNSIRGSLATAFAVNSTVTIRAKARWLSGWPEILFRVRGNGIELPVTLRLPANLGTPGLPNSRIVENAGPSISEVTHYPPVPAANQAVVVTARISDPDGVLAAQLIYRADPGTATTVVRMHDDGVGGDGLAGDGIYSATIPARPSGVVAFRIQAQDGAAVPASGVFPDDAPTRECVIRWADPTPFGSFPHYHLWSTAASASDLASKPGLDRKYRDCTIVYNTRVIYNAGWRNKGSPFHGGLGSYSSRFADDDLLLGSGRHVFRSSGNGGDESTEMADDVSYWMAGQMGLPFSHSHYMRLYRNGALHYPVDYDIEVPDRSIAKDWFGGGGLDDTLFKISGWFECDDSNGNGPTSLVWASFQKKPVTAPPYKLAAYRFNWQPHPGARTANDYSLIYNLLTAANATDRITQLMNLADVEQWMRMFAYRRVLGDWDSWSYNTGQNMYLYAPLGRRATLMSWDVDFVLGLGDGATVNQLFSAGEDGVIGSLFNVPAYRRMLWRGYQDAVNGPLQKDVSDAQFDARRAALVKNNVPATAPTSLKSYVSSRRNFLQTQIKNSDAAAFSITTKDFTSATSTATVTGIAPFGVATIEINGVAYPVTWTGNTAWTIKVPLSGPASVLQIVGKDLRGRVYQGATGQVTVKYAGTAPQPQDWVVINEIMYYPARENGEFVELFNRHPSYAFDVSGFKLGGTGFCFAPGTFIQPNRYLLVARNSAAFAAAYGATIPLAGEFPGDLKPGGEVVRLIKPGAAPENELVISEVRYENTPPWPVIESGAGVSLQLIDPAQDTRRVGNWAVGAAPPFRTPGAANSVASTLPDYPPLWINEVQPENVDGLGDSTGRPKPWVELYNCGPGALSLATLYLAGNYTNLTQWAFPTNAQVNPGEFKVIFVDGQPLLTTATELHASFQLPAGSGSVALCRLENGQPKVLDYVNYSRVGTNHSYGSFPDGQPIERMELLTASPGALNIYGAGDSPRFDQIVLSGTQLTLGWTTLPGRTYGIELKDDLNQFTWTRLGANMTATGTSLSTNLNVLRSAQRFLRIVRLD